MSEIIVADNSGFCFGVINSVKLALKAKEENPDKKILILGQLVHNNAMSGWLRERGIEEINSLDDVKNPEKSIVIIRAHGEPKETYALLKERNISFVDATCPFVLDVQKKAAMLEEKGFKVVVVGKASHPEVKGILSHTKEGIAVNKLEDLPELKEKKIGVVSQTTHLQKVFGEITGKLAQRSKYMEVHNTICLASIMHRHSAIELAKQVDLMIVIGGKHSSNTQKLAKACSEFVETWHIEDAKELDVERALSYPKIGITAGASTPDFSIKEVVVKLGGKAEQVDQKKVIGMSEIAEDFKID